MSNHGSRMSTIPSSDENKEMIRTALVRSYKDVFQKLLERVGQTMVLDETGHAHLTVPRDKLSDSTQIALQLIARKFANTAGITPTDTMSVDELAEATGIPYKTVTARAAGLKRLGRIESDERGAYRIRYVAIEEILNEVEHRTRGETSERRP